MKIIWTLYTIFMIYMACSIINDRNIKDIRIEQNKKFDSCVENLDTKLCKKNPGYRGRKMCIEFLIEVCLNEKE